MFKYIFISIIYISLGSIFNYTKAEDIIESIDLIPINNFLSIQEFEYQFYSVIYLR